MSDTTKRQLDAGSQADRSKSTSPPVGPHELQYRIPCRGRSSGQVLDDVARALAEAEAKDRDPLLVLEDLGLLEDSIASLIKGISRIVFGYPPYLLLVAITMWAVRRARQPISVEPETA